jgi:hypothetical protein
MISARRACARVTPNYRVMLEMYVGTTAGILERARVATE